MNCLRGDDKPIRNEALANPLAVGTTDACDAPHGRHTVRFDFGWNDLGALMMKSVMMLLLALAGAASAHPVRAQPAPASGFEFRPTPRWSEEPETSQFCAAVRKECPALARKPSVDVEFSYERLYDASGRLVGVRSVKSTGCAPIDEDLLVSERHSVEVFRHPGRPDLEGIRVEGPPGAKLDGVRIVQGKSTTYSLECNPG
jgi:hypothetical protein